MLCLIFFYFCVLAGNIALIIIGCVKVGGVSRVMEINREWGRFEVSGSADPTERLNIWSVMFGGFFFLISIIGANQPCMQRTCTLKNLSLARWSAILGGTMMAVFTVLSMVVGLVIFAYYTSLGCDPVQSGQVSSGNQILPFYIMDVLAYPGVPGLLFSGIFSAALSSLSSSINSMSAVMWRDILEPYFKNWTESRKTIFNKCLTLFFGLCCLASSFVMMFVGGSLISIAAACLGAVLGPLLGVFFLAILVPFSNWIGALTGGLISAALNLWILFGAVISGSLVSPLPAPTHACPVEPVANATDVFLNSTTAFLTTPASAATDAILNQEAIPDERSGLQAFYSISFMLYPLVGALVTMVIGCVVSLFTGYTKTKDVDPKLVASFVYCGPKEVDSKEPNKELKVKDTLFLEPKHWSRKQVVSSI